MLGKYVKQQIQAEGEVILNCSSEEFQTSLSQRIHFYKEQDIELLNSKLLQEAIPKGYLGWVGTDSFFIRPVDANKTDPINRFIIEGTFYPQEEQTKVKFLIRPDYEGRLRINYFIWMSLLTLWAFILLKITFNLLIIVAGLALGITALVYASINQVKPFLPECKSRFTQLLRSLYFNREAEV